jgi:hypothetical protein
MPAITLSRLKIQAAQLADNYRLPDLFIRELRNLLDFYADHTRRPGQSGEQSTLLRSYHTPAPVLRQVIKELTPFLEGEPQAIPPLCDALWKTAEFEPRLLAATLLGKFPPDPASEVTKRVNTWALEALEDRLLDVLLDQGLARLRSEAVREYLGLLEEWLTSSQGQLKQAGLRLIKGLAEDARYNNLPRLYQALTPLVREAPTALRPDLLAALYALAKRSAQETAYYLRQNLDAPEAVDTAWVVRQALNWFEPPLRDTLRSALAQPRSRT